VAPTGTFLATVDAPQVLAGRGIWDFSGHYQSALGGSTLSLDLGHATSGKLGGTGRFYPPLAGPKEDYFIAVTPAGSVKLAKGMLSAKLTLKGKQTGIPGDPAAKASVSISLTLALDPAARTLSGPWKATWVLGSAKASDAGPVSLDVPPGMDGTYGLLFELVGSGTDVGGDAALQLANGAEYLFTVDGTYGGTLSTVTLTGTPENSPAKAIKITTSIKTLDDGTALLKTFSGKAYGQVLKW
jgi:hypothetical protein